MTLLRIKTVYEAHNKTTHFFIFCSFDSLKSKITNHEIPVYSTLPLKTQARLTFQEGDVIIEINTMDNSTESLPHCAKVIFDFDAILSILL